MDETIEEIGRAEQGDAEMVDAENEAAVDKEGNATTVTGEEPKLCLLYTSPSPRDRG